MNQILVTNEINNKNKKGINIGKDINSIIKFFAIAMIIFGVVLSSNGVYATIQIAKEKNSTSVPVVITQRTGNSINLTVKNDIGIKSVKYAWNDSTEKVVEGKNNKEVNALIPIIAGTNKLNITVLDANNNTTKYVKNFVQNEDDTTEPVITISNEDPKIKITVTDDTALDHITYKYANNDEVTVNASADDPTKIEAYVDNIEEAQETLKVVAVDKAQNTATKEQQVKGTTKSKIEVTQDQNDKSYLIIKVTDNDGIRMVAYYINGQEYQTDPNTSLNTKSFEYRQKIDQGQTNITVHAYNLSQQVTEYTNTFNY